MKVSFSTSLSFIGILSILLSQSCKAPTEKKDEVFTVRIGMTAEPDVLNPITYKTINAQVINSLLFQKLLDIDFQTLELIPVLAESLPEMKQLNDSLYTLNYQIRKNARWDNGKPITGHDVLFSIKLGLIPGIGNEGKKEYLDCIRDISVDESDPQSITFICSASMRMEYASGSELGILPAYHYDPDSVIQSISLSEITAESLDSATVLKVKTWAEKFNSPEYQRIPGGVIGSGPYSLQEWQTNQRIVLERKSDHWSTSSNDTNVYFEHFPEQITYHIMSEPAALIAAARNDQIDAGAILRSADYIELKTDQSFTDQFYVKLAPELSTNVIILNACTPKLESQKTRLALAYLFDTKTYIEKIQRSTGQQITGPLHPSKSTYNKEITPYSYDLKKATALLKADGWSDMNNDGILEKEINGELVPLKLKYFYNTGNEGRKNTGLLFKEWVRPAGIEIEVVNLEWMMFIETLMAKDFDMAIFSWTDEHAPTDPTTLYHSDAIEGGYNFGCFRNQQADSLMELMSETIDPKKRKEQWHLLQEILHREVANIFLSTNDARFFLSRRLLDVSPSSLPPGYWVGSFKREKSD